MRELDTVGDVLVDAQGRPVSLIGTCRDITDDPRERAQRLQAGERRALEMLAAGAPLPDILAELARLIEEMAPETITSILLMDDTGTRIQHGAAPSLPDAFNLGRPRRHHRSPGRLVRHRGVPPRAGVRHRHRDRSAVGAVSRPGPSPRAARLLVVSRSWPPTARSWAPSRSTTGSRGPPTRRWSSWSRAWHTWPASPSSVVSSTNGCGRCPNGPRRSARMSAHASPASSHDQLGQSLTALKLDISWLTRRLAGDPAVMRQARRDEAGRGRHHPGGRAISAELRPDILDVLGLQAAIEWQAEEFTRRTGVTCELRARLDDVPIWTTAWPPRCSASSRRR